MAGVVAVGPAAAGGERPAASAANMRAAAEAFEALFVRELLKAARVSGATGEWQDMIERHMADTVASGAPFGFAAALFPAAGKGDAR